MAASSVPAAGSRSLPASARSRATRPARSVQPLLPSKPALHVLLSETCRAGRPDPRGPVLCRAADDEGPHEAKLGPNVLASVKDLRDNVCWSKATVVRNDAITINGEQRLLHLTIDDNVDLMYGRTFNAKQSGDKWIDSYTVPGQSVGIRVLQEAGQQAPSDSDLHRVYGIASSPYQSRRDSAYLDSSLIEVVVSRQGDSKDQQLASLGPGALLEVSQVVGRGFSSLLNSYEGLPASINERRPLLLLGIGAEGIAPLRAALNWTPLQAHASSHPVTALYVADSASSAACLPEWDQWREAGVTFRPLYLQDREGQHSVETATPQQLLDFVLEHILLTGGVSGLLGGAKAAEATCLIAGARGELASGLSRGLSRSGVPRERILFCEYF